VARRRTHRRRGVGIVAPDLRAGQGSVGQCGLQCVRRHCLLAKQPARHACAEAAAEAKQAIMVAANRRRPTLYAPVALCRYRHRHGAPQDDSTSGGTRRIKQMAGAVQTVASRQNCTFSSQNSFAIAFEKYSTPSCHRPSIAGRYLAALSRGASCNVRARRSGKQRWTAPG
jgi:hypothetical protein